MTQTQYCWLSPDTSSTHKLTSSAIAPLVARARGYEHITSDTLETNKTLLRYRSKNQAWYRTLDAAATNGGFLYMPWYSAALLGEHVPQPSVIQLRPTAAIASADSVKAQKYINEPGKESVLDTHPGTPVTYLDTAPRIIITEGLLKADSALTAYLLSHGVPSTDLDSADGLTIEQAREKLSAIMAAIPIEHQTLIIGVVGVGNWHHKPEWHVLQFAHKNVLLAFDADVASNPHVWWQAEQMRKLLEQKNADVSILRLPPDADDTKQGIDDFFAAGHTFENLLDHSSHMPPRPSTMPEDDTTPVGSWRVNPDGTSTSKLSTHTLRNRFGESYAVKEWQPSSPFGGRVLACTHYRFPTAEEMSTGVANNTDPSASADDATAEVEVAWKDRDGRVCSDVVSGPIEMLSEPASRWAHLGAHGAKVVRQSGWPVEDRGWLDAVKEHRCDETNERTKYVRMGWIPTDDMTPYFVVGRQRISWDGIHDDALDYYSTVPGHTTIEGFDRFGVAKPREGVNWVEQAKADLAWLGKAFFDPQHRAWRSLADAGIVLALMVRPALPVRSTSVVYMYGPAGSGKSWSAAAAMMGWQARGGTWTNQSLPGSARDTYASTEISLARTPLWVMDDFAPSVSRQATENLENMIGDIVRFVHDGTPRRRSSPSGKLQQAYSPHGLLILTGENELSTPSVNERLTHVYMDSKSLRTVEMVNEGGAQCVPSRLVGAFIRWLALNAAASSWQELITYQHQHQKDGYPMGDPEGHYAFSSYDRAMNLFAEKNLRAHEGLLNRAATMFADLSVGLNWFARFALEVCSGWLDDKQTPTSYVAWTEDYQRRTGVNLFERVTDTDQRMVCWWNRWADIESWFEIPDELRGLSRAFTDEVIALKFAEQIQRGAKKTPGHRLIQALGDVLSSRSAVLVGEDGQLPSIDGYTPGDFGWSPQGDGSYSMGSRPVIGTVIMRHGQAVALLEPRTAFTVAARHRPELVLPGQKCMSSWLSAKTQGLLYEDMDGGWAMPDGRYTALVKTNGHPRRVTPVLIETLHTEP